MIYPDNEQVIKFSELDITRNVAGALRVAEITRLFAGKTLYEDDPNLWDTKGTGTGTFNNNMFQMSVASGQYLVRQSRRPVPYFEGSPIVGEFTTNSFHLEDGLTKSFGLYSSSTTAPYNTVYDGCRVIHDATSLRFETTNAGSVTQTAPYTSWDNYNALNFLNFSGNLERFKAFLIEKLWLGGVAYRLWISTPYGWVVAHTLSHIDSTGTIELSPNQFVRFEVRADVGFSGSFTAVCSQASADNGKFELGKPIILENTSAITTNTAGTLYALIGIKKRTDRPLSVVMFKNISYTTNSSSGNAGHVQLLLNPTLSAPITYADKTGTGIAFGLATTQTVTSPGTVIDIVSSRAVSTVANLLDNAYAALSQEINNTMDEYVLAFRPTISTQNGNGIVTMRQF